MNSRQNSFAGFASKRQQAQTGQASSKQTKSIIEIYTDWANHYLDKLPGCKKIKDLQTELGDGIVLSDVIEGVIGQKVPNLHKKPKNATQMTENLQSCLKFLLERGVGVQEIQAKDIREGNLKSILGLFFQLSRYKQQQKINLQQMHGEPTETPRIPSVPPSPCRGIPTPTSNLSPGRRPPLHNDGPKSGLPKTSASRLGGAPQLQGQKISILDRIKPKPQHSESQLPTVTSQFEDVPRGLGKRTSSSSGFSSARSVSSKSSAASVSSDTNFPSPSAMKRIQENVTIPSQSSAPPHRSPRTAQKSFAGSSRKPSKIPNGNYNSPASASGRSPCGSPKRSSPKLVRAASGHTEIKDYGPIDQRLSANYPPHGFAAQSKSKQESPSKIPNGIKVSTSSGIQKPGHHYLVPGSKNIYSDSSAKSASTKPLPNSENDPAPTAAQAKSCSLPRQKRDESCPTNVAVVSPMPNATSSSTKTDADQSVILKASEDVMKVNTIPTSRQQYLPLTTMTTMVHSGPMSDLMGQRRDFGSDSGPHLPGLHHAGYSSEADTYRSDIQEDGYYSEGGSSFYARKIQSRIAAEKQKTAEEQRKKLEEAFESKSRMRRPLPGLPDVLAASATKEGNLFSKEDQGDQNSNAIYRVVGGRKHVQKSEASMQTELPITSSDKQSYDWKKAMAHNAKILSNQEKAMDEYLRRQRASAEQHISQLHCEQQSAVRIGANEGLVSLQDHHNVSPRMPLCGMLPSAVSSTPATPTGSRRAHHLPVNSFGVDPYGNRIVETASNIGSGSLERGRIKTSGGGYDPVALSDSEFASRSSRKTSSPSHSPTPTKRDAIFGSRSLPKGTSSLNYGLMLDRIHQKRQNRINRVNDGSLSDSNYATYGDSQRSPHYTWLHPASTYFTSSNQHDQPLSLDGVGSNESLNSVSSSIQQARASSLTKARLMIHQRQLQDNQQAQVPGSGRAFLPSTSSCVEMDYYGVPLGQNGQKFKSQPTSPLKNLTMVEEFSVRSCIEQGSQYAFQDRGSSLSLHSSTSAINQEKQTDAEIQRLRRELAEEHEKVLNLSSQLVTNSHVVAAFEQSLGNMTARLQQLTTSAERKDSELNELRRTVERLRQAGVEVGLIDNKLRRQTSTDSVDSCQSGDESSIKKKTENAHKRSGWLRHSFSKAFSKNAAKTSKGYTRTSGSLSDVEGADHGKRSSAVANDDRVRCASAASGSIPDTLVKGSQSSSELNVVSLEIVDDLKRKLNEKDSLLTEIRLEALSSTHQLESMRETVSKMRNELMSLKVENEKLQSMVSVQRCSSTVSTNIDVENEKRPLSTLSDNSLLSAPSSLDLSGTTDPTHQDGGKHLTVSVVLGSGTEERSTRLGTVAVSGKSNWELLDSLVHRLFKEYLMRIDPVGNLGLYAESIDFYQLGEVRRSNASEKPDLLPYGYIFGDVSDIKIRLRHATSTHRGSGICQPCVDELSFETLTPKPIVQRYASLLLEQKRLIISGPPSSGKSYLAHKLGQFLLDACGDNQLRGASIATFTIQMNNLNELRDFFNLRMSPSSPSGVTPRVVILENLHQGGNLDDLFRDVLPANINISSPYIIGTLNPSTLGPSSPTGAIGISPTNSASPTSVATNLQLHYNFRTVVLSHHAEPLRGFLGRYLRQRLLAIEIRSRVQDLQMNTVVDWLSKVHIHINKILESHNCGADTTIGVTSFMTCPLDDMSTSRAWFIRFWNETIVPHMREAIREGLQLHGQRNSWTDPTGLIIESWPWWSPPDEQLMKLNPSEVGYDVTKSGGLSDATSSRPTSSTGSGDDSDPLFNMLVHLQEAANNESFSNE